MKSQQKNEASAGKKPYRRPNLQTYGRVHLLTQGSGGNGRDADSSMTMMSDRRAKQNLLRVGTHPIGVGLYLFDYRPDFRDVWGHGRQLGVMADEVEAVMPEAVSRRLDGFKVVDYAMLGHAASRASRCRSRSTRSRRTWPPMNEALAANRIQELSLAKFDVG